MENPFGAPVESWPEIDSCDVAVVGAGPAGIAAAVAASRLGARTILIESYGYAGGTAVHANVPNILGFARNDRQIVGGFAEEFARRLSVEGRTSDGYPDSHDHITRPVRTTVHGIRVVAASFLREAGVHTLFYTRLIGGIVDGSRITALVVDCVEGAGLVRARTIVDATGDAHLVHRCGGATREASPEESMTKTMIITVGGVRDFDRERSAARFDRLVASRSVPFASQTRFMAYRLVNPGEVALNFTLEAGDGLRSAELTRMDMSLRDQIDRTIEWIRKNLPGFERAYLVDSAIQTGVRSGRVIVGRETISQADIDDDTPVAQPIAIGVRYYGDHGISEFRSPWAKNHHAPRPIPWRTLLPVSFDNVAAAGRCISVEPRVVTCVRLIAQCMATGQAAGTNAALAAEADVSLEDAGYDTLRDLLVGQRAILSGEAAGQS